MSGAVVKRPVMVLVFVLLVILFAISLLPGILRLRALEERSRLLEKELIQLRANDKALETELRLLRDDPVYLEKVARAQFNKAKQGEIVYRVVREGEPKGRADS